MEEKPAIVEEKKEEEKPKSPFTPIPVSLRARISSAKTADEVQQLLKEGATYDMPSVGAVKKWKKAAEKRLRELAEQR